jgi:hypothetical protein
MILMTKKEVEGFQFDFGPISRTLGEGGDHLGFASLPVHEAVTALLGARNRDEFIAWLWHDTFKTLFELVDSNGKRVWQHYYIDPVPTTHYLKPIIDRLASNVGISSDYINAHHSREHVKRKYFPQAVNMLSESTTVTNEFIATYLGSQARFVQLSFACQPTAHTMPLRQCIAEAFLRAVSQVVANGITELDLSFSRVLYSFQAQPDELTPEQIAAQYQLQVVDETLYIVHWVPSGKFETAQLSLDLNDAPPRRETPDSLALIELLTVYRDELTTVAAVPLFLGDLDTVVEEIRTEMGALLPDILEQMSIQVTHKKAATDGLLDVVLEQMVEVRSVSDDCNKEYEVMWKGKSQRKQGKPIHKLIQRPYQLMADSARERTCVVCGSPITQGAADCYRGSPRLQNIFSGNFADFEHVGFEGVVCPLCLIYANSKNTKLLRGAQAFLSPSTALNAPMGAQLLEKPRFDNAGRFDPTQPLPKTAVTLQEMVLLTAISRRIVDTLLLFSVKSNGELVSEVQMIKPSNEDVAITPVDIHLPYTGAYLIYDQTAVRSLYQDVLVGGESGIPSLWQTVQLRAYPFQLEIAPAFTLLISMRDSASNFHTRHTLLKSHPTQVFLSPNASFTVLVDDAVQETVDSELVEAIRLVRRLMDVCDLKDSAKYKERSTFIKALLTGHDPIEAVYLAVSAKKEESFRLAQARRLWNEEEVTTGETAEEQWLAFNQLAERVRDMAQAHPTLLSLI